MNRLSFRVIEGGRRDERGPAFVPEPLYRERPTPATGLAIALVGGVMMWAAAAVVVRWWWRL